MYNKRVKVIGGVVEKQEDNQGKKSTSAFTVKKIVVVEDRHIGTLLRRDDYLRSLSLRLEETTEPLTEGLFFSELKHS